MNGETHASDNLAWTAVEACTLPTAERPLRLGEFDDLFASTREVRRSGSTQARVLLAGDEAVAARARRLAEAETSCCSFFGFAVSTPEPGVVALDVTVPPPYADVLAGLVDRAEARGAA